jgi:dephospho-CoA kinase
LFKVGVTGGIGSGKSTVCGVFEVLGIPVYYADDRARDLMQTDAGLRHSLQVAFGQDVYADGNLNRALLSQKVFNDPAALSRLNALVHPVVLHDFENWTQRQSAPYAIKEAALIFEAGSDKHLDKVIVVDAPQEERINRIVARDSVTRDAVLARMRSQWPQEEKVSRADYVVVNSGERLVIPQVLAIHSELLSMASRVPAQSL